MKRLWGVLGLAAAAACGRQPIDLGPDIYVDSGAPPSPVDAPLGTPDAPVQAGPYRALSIAVGRKHACALRDDHSVTCWGDDSEGQLRANTALKAAAIVARGNETCALLDDGGVRCWGARNPSVDGAIDLGGRKATSIVLAEQEGCAACDDGAILCWSYGRSVVPPSVVTRRPAAAVVTFAGADLPVGLFADGSISTVSANPDRIVDNYGLPDGQKARALFGLRSRLCATLTSGGLKCWNETAPTLDTNVAALAFTELGGACWITTAGVVKCRAPFGPWADADGAGGPGIVKLGRAAIALDGGGQQFMCALLADGGVKCWSWGTADEAWLGGSIFAGDDWPDVDLGTRPAP